MSETTESNGKQYDAEETREEQAARLTAKRANKLRAETKTAREQFRRHVPRLSEDQRRSLVAYLRRDFEATLGVVEDSGQDSPEFSFVPDYLVAD